MGEQGLRPEDERSRDVAECFIPCDECPGDPCGREDEQCPVTATAPCLMMRFEARLADARAALAAETKRADDAERLGRALNLACRDHDRQNDEMLAAERQAREQAERERDEAWRWESGDGRKALLALRAALLELDVDDPDDPAYSDPEEIVGLLVRERVEAEAHEIGVAQERDEARAELAIIRACHGPCEPLSPPGLTLEQTTVRTVFGSKP